MSDTIDYLGGLGFLQAQAPLTNEQPATNIDTPSSTQHTVTNLPNLSLPLPIANKLRNLIQVSTASTAPYAEFVHPTYLRVFRDIIVTGVNYPLPKLLKSAEVKAQSKEEENNEEEYSSLVDTSRAQEPPAKKAKQDASKTIKRVRTSNIHMAEILQRREGEYKQSNIEERAESGFPNVTQHTSVMSLEQEENSSLNPPPPVVDDTNSVSTVFFHARLEFVVKELMGNTLRSRHAKTRLLGLQLLH